jgi:hypothetical protein
MLSMPVWCSIESKPRIVQLRASWIVVGLYGNSHGQQVACFLKFERHLSFAGIRVR